MSDKPIIFSAPMVRALLEGRKIQTRRVLKPQPPADAHMVRAYTDNAPRPALRNTIGWFVPEAGDLWPCDDGDRIPLPYAPGDRLWVRESFSGLHRLEGYPPSQWLAAQIDTYDGLEIEEAAPIWYWANGGPTHGDWTRPRSSIHMPRWASRLTLLVTDVRVQRLQEISDSDCRAEGLPMKEVAGVTCWSESQNGPWTPSEALAFSHLWNSLHGPDAWHANPWVCALSFTVHRCNIDQMEARDDRHHHAP